MTVATATGGAFLAVISGIMNGVFSLPMRFLGKWSWENVWLLFILVCCVILPIAVVSLTVSSPFAILAQAPLVAVIAAIGSGCLWGIGAIMFGQAVSAVGISLANTIVLALSASLGALFPMVILNSTSLTSKHGALVLLGTAIAIMGMVISGFAGRLREKNRSGLNTLQQEGEGTLVGRRRPMRIAMLLCVGAGLLSAVFNIGFSLAQPIIEAGERVGFPPSDGTDLVWLLMLGSGAVANVAFCLYLIVKNKSGRKFLLPGSGRLYLLTALMGLLWGGSIFVYGEASTRLGKLGPAVGWPLFLTTGLLVSNVCGILTGEWRSVSATTRWWIGCALVVLVAAILVLGKAGAM